jgi:hypothetical protein
MNWQKEKIAALIVLAVLLLCKVIVTVFYEEPELKPYSNVRPAKRIVIEGISFTTTFPDRSYYDEAKQNISISVENEPSKDTHYRLLDAKFCEGKVILKRRNDRRDLYEYDIYETDGNYIMSYVVNDGSRGLSNAWFKNGMFYYYCLRLDFIIEVAHDGTSELYYTAPAHTRSLYPYITKPESEAKYVTEGYRMTVNTVLGTVKVIDDNGNTVIIK